MNNTIFIINSNGQIEEVNYRELVNQSVEMTTSHALGGNFQRSRDHEF
jgi:hypothetical protein